LAPFFSQPSALSFICIPSSLVALPTLRFYRFEKGTLEGESLWRNESHLGALSVGFHLTIDSFSTTLGYVSPLPQGVLHSSPLLLGVLSQLNAITDLYKDSTSPEIARKQSAHHPHRLRKQTQTVIRIPWQELLKTLALWINSYEHFLSPLLLNDQHTCTPDLLHNLCSSLYRHYKLLSPLHSLLTWHRTLIY